MDSSVGVIKCSLENFPLVLKGNFSHKVLKCDGSTSKVLKKLKNKLHFCCGLVELEQETIHNTMEA